MTLTSPAPPVAPAESAQDVWLKRWTERDFTWDGLAQIEIVGGGRLGDATLQSYWLRDPETGARRRPADLISTGEIAPVEEGEPLFHLVHTPCVWNGRPTWKANSADPRWARVRALVEARIWQGQDTLGEFDEGFWTPGGDDGRARLDGAVLKETPLHRKAIKSPIHACFELVAFSGNVSWRENEFGEGVTFAGALFEGAASFEDCLFRGGSSFEGAQFLRTAMFRNARLLGPSLFAGAKFGSDVRFDGARFRQQAEFGGWEFAGFAVFDEARFLDDVRFAPSNLSNTSFIGTKFESAADFNKCELGPNSRFERIWFAKVHVIARKAFGTFLLLVLLTTALSWLALLSAMWVVAAIAVLFAILTMYWSLAGATLVAGGNRVLTQLAVDFRRMKAICDEQKNGRAEAVFHALELKATRLQYASSIVGNITSKPAERFVSMLYEGMSNYGLSIGRPILWLVFSIALFGSTYWVWDLTGFKSDRFLNFAPMGKSWIGRLSEVDDDYLDAITFAVTRIVPVALPVEHGMTRPPPSCSFQKRLLAIGSRMDGEECRPEWINAGDRRTLAWHRLLTRLVVGLQTLVSGVLVFLIGLGIRRRFQTD